MLQNLLQLAVWVMILIIINYGDTLDNIAASLSLDIFVEFDKYCDSGQECCHLFYVFGTCGIPDNL